MTLGFLAPDVATGMLLSAAHRRSQKLFNQALQPLEIEERHFATLAVLDGAGPLTQRQLTDLLELDKSSLGRIVDELERQGLVERRPVPTDRRAHSVHLTTDGRDRLRHGHRIAAEIGQQLFGGLSPDARNALNRALEQIARESAR